MQKSLYYLYINNRVGNGAQTGKGGFGCDTAVLVQPNNERMKGKQVEKLNGKEQD